MPEFEEHLKKVHDLNPDVCFVPGYDTDTGVIIKQAREMGIRAVFLSGDGVSDNIFRYSECFAEGTYYCSHWHPESAYKRSRQFVHAYEKEYGKLLEAAPALSYDAVILLADAVKRAKSLDPAKIRNALAATRGVKGVTGEITFDKNRNPISKSAVILKFEKGKSYM